MQMTEAVDYSGGTLVLGFEQWMNANFVGDGRDVLIGDPKNPIVRLGTKNFVEAAEKSFKTTFTLRLALGLASGTAVFKSLDIPGSRRVLYLHGELSPAELQERLRDAAQELPRPIEKFFQGRSIDAHLIKDGGRKLIREMIEKYTPEILIIDPWQSFISEADENSFKEVSGATSFMDKLISDYNLTLFLPIHLGKNHDRGARGHSVLGGWRDTRFILDADGTRLTVKIEPRWAKPPDPLDLTFKDGTLWEGDAPTETRQQRRIREIVAANGGTAPREVIALALGKDHNSVRMPLKRAADAGVITLEDDIVRLSA